MTEQPSDLSDTTETVLESATRLVSAAGDQDVIDEYVAGDTGLPIGVVRDSLQVLGQRHLETQKREDGSVTVRGVRPPT